MYLHHSWSGDLLAGAFYYMPSGTPPDVLSYWWPETGGVVQNDFLAVTRAAESPVLAHMFLNFLLEETIAYENFTQFNGYVPPQNGIDAESLVSEGLDPGDAGAGRRAARPVPRQPGAAPADGRGRAALGPGLVGSSGPASASMESRWIWRLLALPGVAWLSVFFLVAFYAVLCVAFGNQNTLNEPVPFWNPLDWNVGYVDEVLQNIRDGGQYLTLFLRTFAYVRSRSRSRCSSATRSPTTRRAMPGAGAA